MKFHIVINQTSKNLSEIALCLSACLFQLLEAEMHVLKKAGFGNLLGEQRDEMRGMRDRRENWGLFIKGNLVMKGRAQQIVHKRAWTFRLWTSKAP